MRRTLRGSLRTAGDPIRLARRRRRVVPPADRAAVRHLGLDGAVRPRVPPVPDVCGRRRGGGANAEGVRVRDAPDPPHARAGLAQPRARDPARRDRRRPTGRAAPGSATRLKTFNDRHGRRGHGPRRGRRDPVRRLGARRPRARRARDGAAAPARLPDRVGQPARQRSGLRGSRRRSGRGAARTATRSSAATASRRSARSPTRSARRGRTAPAVPASRCRPRPGPGPRRSRGRARRRCRAARWRCPAATGRAVATRPRMVAGDMSAEDVHLPRLRPPGGAAAPARRPAAELLRPRGAQRADRPPGAPASRAHRRRSQMKPERRFSDGR